MVVEVFQQAGHNYYIAWDGFQERFYRYFKKLENYTTNAHDSQVDASVHGANGPMKVGYNSHSSKGGQLFVKSGVGIGIPYSADFNTSAGTIGINRVRDPFR